MIQILYPFSVDYFKLKIQNVNMSVDLDQRIRESRYQHEHINDLIQENSRRGWHVIRFNGLIMTIFLAFLATGILNFPHSLALSIVLIPPSVFFIGSTLLALRVVSPQRLNPNEEFQQTVRAEIEDPELLLRLYADNIATMKQNYISSYRHFDKSVWCSLIGTGAIIGGIAVIPLINSFGFY